MIEVNGNLFRAVMAFASTEETRYYLNGVYIEPHETGALLVATDGHRLVCVHDVDAKCDKAAIVKLPPVMLAALAPEKIVIQDEGDEEECGGDTQSTYAEGPARSLTIDADGIATVGKELRSAHSVFIDGKYPDWRKVVNAIDLVESAGPFQMFNCEYLATFAKMARLLSEGNNSQVMFVPGKHAEGPMLVLFPVAANAFAVVMSTKPNTAVLPKLPAFMEPKKVAA